MYGPKQREQFELHPLPRRKRKVIVPLSKSITGNDVKRTSHSCGRSHFRMHFDASRKKKKSQKEVSTPHTEKMQITVNPYFLINKYDIKFIDESWYIGNALGFKTKS